MTQERVPVKLFFARFLITIGGGIAGAAIAITLLLEFIEYTSMKPSHDNMRLFFYMGGIPAFFGLLLLALGFVLKRAASRAPASKEPASRK